MKAEELRIGNLFWENHGGYKIVTAINCNIVGDMQNTVSARAKGHTTSGQYDCDKIEPIPLTSEILEKIGFIPNENKSWYNLKIGNDKLGQQLTLTATKVNKDN
jgi:hypothetical protein